MTTDTVLSRDETIQSVYVARSTFDSQHPRILRNTVHGLETAEKC